MKLVKKVLAVALTGAMALSMFAACDTSTLSSDKLVAAVNAKLSGDSITISSEATALAKQSAAAYFAQATGLADALEEYNEELADANNKSDADEKAEALALAEAKYETAKLRAASAVNFTYDGTRLYMGYYKSTDDYTLDYTINGEDAEFVAAAAESIAGGINYMRSQINGNKKAYKSASYSSGSASEHYSNTGAAAYYIKTIDSIGYYVESRDGNTYVFVCLGITSELIYNSDVPYTDADGNLLYGDADDDGIYGDEAYEGDIYGDEAYEGNIIL